jgi:methionyl-tRNA formyltransferase
MLRPTPVKQAAIELGLAVEQPPSLRDPDVQSRFADHAPDVVAVAAYGLILPREVLAIPALGCINVHASLLPRWRGAAPIQAAILAGDEITGVSIMQMEEGLDTGPYCLQVEVPAKGRPLAELTADLAEEGAAALIDALDHVARSSCTWTEQDEASATYAPKITREDVALTPELDASQALVRVLASSPQAPARLRVAGTGITVVEATISSDPLPPRHIACTKLGLILGFAAGTLALDRIRPDGKAEMNGCDWARGARLGQEAEWEADS